MGAESTTRAGRLATAGAAAATPATWCGRRPDARLGRAAVGRKDRELLADVAGAALRAVRLTSVADELLKVRLAFHADVLVDRHRR